MQFLFAGVALEPLPALDPQRDFSHEEKLILYTERTALVSCHTMGSFAVAKCRSKRPPSITLCPTVGVEKRSLRTVGMLVASAILPEELATISIPQRHVYCERNWRRIAKRQLNLSRPP